MQIGSKTAVHLFDVLPKIRDYVYTGDAAYNASLDSNTIFYPTYQNFGQEYELTQYILKNDVVIFKISPNNKSTKKRLAQYRKIALAAGKIPLICISANWCELCQEIFVALNDEDAKSVMKQVEIILLDIDDWGINLYDINIAPTCVPVFFDIEKDGKAGQLTVDGGAWDDDSIPHVIAEVLKNTFNLNP